MKKIKIKTYEDKIILSVGLSSIIPLIRLCGKSDGLGSYISSNTIIRSLSELVPVISRENFTDKKYRTFIRNVSLGINVITSAIISIKTNGEKFFIEFCLNLISGTSSILIIDKLNELNIVDGVSIFILINCIIRLIKMLSGGVIDILLNLLMCLMFIIVDYNILKICCSYDKFEFKNTGNYNFTLMICNNFFGPKIGSMIFPIMLYVLNFGDYKKIKKDSMFNSNNMLDGIRPNKTNKKLHEVLIKYTLEMSVIGCVTMILGWFVGLDVAMLSLLTSSLLTLKDDFKAAYCMLKVKYVQWF